MRTARPIPLDTVAMPAAAEFVVFQLLPAACFAMEVVAANILGSVTGATDFGGFARGS